MTNKVEALRIIAFESRAAFEQQRIPRDILAPLYLAYNPNIEDIDSFLHQASGLFPALNCGLTAVYLRHRMGEGEVVTGTYDSQLHTFLALGDLAVDITADQFGGPAVYVDSLITPWQYSKKGAVEL